MSNSIYKYTNIINGKVYVGYSCDPKRRNKEHIYDARDGSNTPFHCAIRKYGIESFIFEVVMYNIKSLERMCEQETKFIKLFESHKKGYNCDLGGKRTVRNYGELNKSKITEDQAILIINDCRGHRELSVLYGVSETTISDIRIGKSWKYLDRSKAPIYTDNRNRISKEAAISIIRDTCSCSEAVNKYKVHETTVHDIRNSKTWKHLDRSDAPKYKNDRIKITEDIAIRIINDPCPHSVATRKYGTDVRNIRYGKTWKHLDRSNAPVYQSGKK